MFNISDDGENEENTLLQLKPDSCDITENTFDDVEAEYIFLTKTIGWKQGLIETGIEDEPEKNPEGDTNNATKQAEYLFLTEQMGWREGLKIFGEKREGAIMKELNRSMI